MSAELPLIPTLESLEARDYGALVRRRPDVQGLIEHIIRRDRIMYFMLQMERFWFQAPWDVPPWKDGREYKLQILRNVDIGTLHLQELHELLTSLEADVVISAQNRGFVLKRRPCDTPPKKRRQGTSRGSGDDFER